MCALTCNAEKPISRTAKWLFLHPNILSFSSSSSSSSKLSSPPLPPPTRSSRLASPSVPQEEAQGEAEPSPLLLPRHRPRQEHNGGARHRPVAKRGLSGVGLRRDNHHGRCADNGPGADVGARGPGQGMYACAALQDLGFLQAMNLVFTAGTYDGSVLTVLGRNAPLHAVREMPVVGGSGLFRFARGYAVARTHDFDAATGNAVVEYNVYVMHY
uniref:Dirigent protein n=1 Tax=Ananas comosus var. bracteatus TaxID=296719 RepID=A0A6V7QG26_ANACO|nr:unnamed protein product [Ananas comosus var. bracteatus]